MRKLVVYIAGPFRAPSHWGIAQNIRRAEALALEVWRAGAVAICPHLNTMHYQDELPDKIWLDGDLEILSRCDAVVMVPGWEKSKGSVAERAFARERNMPVIDGSVSGSVVDDFKDWLSDVQYTDLVEDSRRRTGL